MERKIYKRTTTNTPATTRTGAVKYSGRGRPSLAAIKARKEARRQLANEENDVAADDEDVAAEDEVEDKEMDDTDVETPLHNTDEEEDDDDDEHLNDVLHNTSGLTAVTDSDDDGFGELVADIVGGQATNLESSPCLPKSQFRQSLYMTEKNTKRIKDGKVKDKGRSRFTAYAMWAREYRKSSKYGKPSNMSKSAESIEAARRLSELWSNVSIKEKNAWRRKAKMQAARAKQRERAGITTTTKAAAVIAANNINNQNSFINRPTTSRTRKLAEDKQKAKDDFADAKPLASTPKRARNNSYRRQQNATQNSNNHSSVNSNNVPLYVTTNGSLNNALNNIKTPLPTIEPIDAAAHLKLLGESLTIIGDRLKEHEGQIAVSGSLSVLLDSLLCSLGPLLCLTTRLPGLDKKPQLKTNLATTLDNIAYVMPGL